MIDNTFLAFFLDTTTAPGTPLTGLSATMTIVNVDNNTTVVNDRPMIEVGSGFYKYVYNNYDANINYAWLADPNSALSFIISGGTQLPSGARGGSGIGGISLDHIKGLENALNKKLKDMWNKMNEVQPEKEVEPIDFTPILDRIDSIKIPEVKLEEKEARKAIKLIANVDKKLSEYLDERLELIKIEMEEKNKQKEKEEEEKMKQEEEKKKEEERDMKELELIKAEFDKQDEQEKAEKKKELEAELKEIEQEKKEIEKELKSL